MYMRKLVLFFLLIFSIQACAQDDVDYSIHANIIYHLTKYVDWPDAKKKGDFVIGIVGYTPLYSELKEAVAGKKAGDQNIIVKKYSSSTTVFDCHILFISDDARNQIKKIVDNTSDKAILLVSESKGLALKGSCINFSIVNEKLKMEINKNNIQQRKLNVAMELLQLGVQVK